MKIDVSKLLAGSLGDTTDRKIEEEVDLPDRGQAAISGAVKLTKLDTSVLAHFDIVAGLNLNCDKCLESFRENLPLSFDREYLLGPQSDPEALAIENSSLDTHDAIVHEVMVSLPIQAVCKPDCKGLCSTCGTNLNTDICEHITENGSTTQKED